MTEQDDRLPDESGQDDDVELVRRVNVALYRSGAESLVNLARRTDMDHRALVNRALQVLDWVDAAQRARKTLILRDEDGTDMAVKIL